MSFFSVRLGGTKTQDERTMVVCGHAPVERDRTKLVLFNNEEVILSLPYTVFMEEFRKFYNDSEDPAFDLSNEALAKLQNTHALDFLKACASYQRGKLVPGKGIFFGTWRPKNRQGNSLNKTFNLYVAPYDLGLDEQGRGKRLTATYNKAVKAVNELTDLMGHTGFRGKNDTDLYRALHDGSYKGEWFIPTREILYSEGPNKNTVQNGHLFSYRKTGILAKTFLMTRFSNSDHWYWSCTEALLFSRYVFSVRFADGHRDWNSKKGPMLSTRLVRAELVS